MTAVLRTRLLSEFTCLGDKCEDTCCKGWSMQVDTNTLDLYKREAPELLESVEPAEEAPFIMRKDPTTSICVKLEEGLCGIHKDYGDRFLNDACHFYPRVTRRLGDQVLMTGLLSCPEIARLAMIQQNPCESESYDVERLPQTLKDYLPEGMNAHDALAIHTAFLQATNDMTSSAEQVFLRIASVTRSLSMVKQSDWPQAVAFYLKNADRRLPPAETQAADPFNLLHALCGLVAASKKPLPPRLALTIGEMEAALDVQLDWQHVLIQASDKSLKAYAQLHQQWQADGQPRYAPMLRRWLAVQFSVALYPFAGLGNSLVERITIIGVRFATLRLALLCGYATHKTGMPQGVAIRLMQSLSRFLDHLGDPAFSLQIYGETGWVREARMRGLIEG